MRATRPIIGGLALICLTGCGAHVSAKGPATPSPAHPSAHPRPTGTVDGQVLRPPGIDPRSGGGAKAPVPVNGDPVEAHDPHGRIVTTAVTVPRGRFKMTLPPGTYQIIESICGVSKKVAVHRGTTTAVTLMIRNAC